MSKIVPLKNAFLVCHPKINGINMHDTFNFDNNGNLFKGHTTINLKKDNKIHIDHFNGKN